MPSLCPMVSCISLRFRWLVVRAGLVLAVMSVLFSSAAEAQAQSTGGRQLLTTPEAVLNAYIDANGGMDLVMNIRSVRLTGSVTEDGATYDIVLVKKRPNMRKIIMRYQGRRITLGFDGTTAWREVTGPGGRHYATIEGEAYDAFVEESQFDGPLVDWEKRGNKVKLLRTEEMGRTDAYVIEVIQANGKQSEIWIESQTMQEVKTISYRPGPDGTMVKIETLMSDYRKFDGIWMALTVERFVDGKSVSLMKITDLNTNFGVFDSYFTPPAEPTTDVP